MSNDLDLRGTLFDRDDCLLGVWQDRRAASIARRRLFRFWRRGDVLVVFLLLLLLFNSGREEDFPDDIVGSWLFLIDGSFGRAGGIFVFFSRF